MWADACATASWPYHDEQYNQICTCICIKTTCMGWGKDCRGRVSDAKQPEQIDRLVVSPPRRVGRRRRSMCRTCMATAVNRGGAPVFVRAVLCAVFQASCIGGKPALRLKGCRQPTVSGSTGSNSLALGLESQARMRLYVGASIMTPPVAWTAS